MARGGWVRASALLAALSGCTVDVADQCGGAGDCAAGEVCERGTCVAGADAAARDGATDRDVAPADAAPPRDAAPPADAAAPADATPPADGAVPDASVPDASVPDGAVPDAIAPCSSPEVCNGVDDDCDGPIDEGVQRTFHRDLDQDGFGDPMLFMAGCEAPDGWIVNSRDCDDRNAAVFPGAPEICDGRDQSCDGNPDEGADAQCARPNAAGLCVGRCTYECQAGFIDDNLAGDDGCERGCGPPAPGVVVSDLPAPAAGGHPSVAVAEDGRWAVARAGPDDGENVSNLRLYTDGAMQHIGADDGDYADPVVVATPVGWMVAARRTDEVDDAPAGLEVMLVAGEDGVQVAAERGLAVTLLDAATRRDGDVNHLFVAFEHESGNGARSLGWLEYFVNDHFRELRPLLPARVLPPPSGFHVDSRPALIARADGFGIVSLFSGNEGVQVLYQALDAQGRSAGTATWTPFQAPAARLAAAWRPGTRDAAVMVPRQNGAALDFVPLALGAPAFGQANTIDDVPIDEFREPSIAPTRDGFLATYSRREGAAPRRSAGALARPAALLAQEVRVLPAVPTEATRMDVAGAGGVVRAVWYEPAPRGGFDVRTAELPCN